MFKVLFLMILALAGLIAGPYLAGKQGYVLIQMPDNNYELSFVGLAVLFVLALAVVYFIEGVISRFFRLSNSTYGWFARRKRAKAEKQTLEGLIRMNEGDYSKAEKLIGRNAKHSSEPILNFIKAAEAAQQRGDEFSANRYLIQATELAGSDNLLVELARTRILLQQNKLPAARSSVDSLLVMAHKNPEVLKLAVEIYQKSKAYQALDEILERIENSGLYSTAEFTVLERSVEDGLLDEKMNEEGSDGLLLWWENQSRKRHKDSYVRVGLIQRLIDCNDHESAYELVLGTLKKVENDNEFSDLLYGQIARLQVEDSGKLIKLLEKRTKQTARHGNLYRALGYLYVRNDEFEQAANAFDNVICDQCVIEANDAIMAAYAFEQAGNLAKAQAVRERHLQSVMAIQPKVEDSDLEQIEKTR
ncbi:MAG: heme biosynthesis protein HemY [Lonepinella koalarum]|nr:heme biosynthesis protein HemY [Lonepinella koalarum]